MEYKRPREDEDDEGERKRPRLYINTDRGLLGPEEPSTSSNVNNNSLDFVSELESQPFEENVLLEWRLPGGNLFSYTGGRNLGVGTGTFHSALLRLHKLTHALRSVHAALMVLHQNLSNHPLMNQEEEEDPIGKEAMWEILQALQVILLDAKENMDALDAFYKTLPNGGAMTHIHKMTSKQKKRAMLLRLRAEAAMKELLERLITLFQELNVLKNSIMSIQQLVQFNNPSSRAWNMVTQIFTTILSQLCASTPEWAINNVITQNLSQKTVTNVNNNNNNNTPILGGVAQSRQELQQRLQELASLINQHIPAMRVWSLTPSQQSLMSQVLQHMTKQLVAYLARWPSLQDIPPEDQVPTSLISYFSEMENTNLYDTFVPRSLNAPVAAPQEPALPTNPQDFTHVSEPMTNPQIQHATVNLLSTILATPGKAASPSTAPLDFVGEENLSEETHREPP